MNVAGQHDDVRVRGRRRPAGEFQVQIGENPDPHVRRLNRTSRTAAAERSDRWAAGKRSSNSFRWRYPPASANTAVAAMRARSTAAWRLPPKFAPPAFRLPRE